MLKLAFAQKRKTLVNNLKGSYGDKAAASPESGWRASPTPAPKRYPGKDGCDIPRAAAGVKFSCSHVAWLK